MRAPVCGHTLSQGNQNKVQENAERRMDAKVVKRTVKKKKRVNTEIQ